MNERRTGLSEVVAVVNSFSFLNISITNRHSPLLGLSLPDQKIFVLIVARFRFLLAPNCPMPSFIESLSCVTWDNLKHHRDLRRPPHSTDFSSILEILPFVPFLLHIIISFGWELIRWPALFTVDSSSSSPSAWESLLLPRLLLCFVPIFENKYLFSSYFLTT